MDVGKCAVATMGIDTKKKHFIKYNNNNVAVIMAEPLQEFTQFTG